MRPKNMWLRLAAAGSLILSVFFLNTGEDLSAVWFLILAGIQVMVITIEDGRP